MPTMNENSPPSLTPAQQPRQRKRIAAGGKTPGITILNSATPPSTPGPAVREVDKKRKQWRNGYEVSPKTPSFVPYELERRGRQRVKPFAFPEESPSKRPRQLKIPTDEDWNRLAREAKALPVDGSLRSFQIQCATYVLKRGRDVCVIAPTGAGKSMLWCLPLLAVPCSVSLVITPYTSLGTQGEIDIMRFGMSAIFIHADRNSDADLEKVAKGGYQVVFICVESVETPRFARVLHSATFKRVLQAIYIDEAHLVKESYEWRPSYGRLGELRKIVGNGPPLVAISATLPSPYRDALCTHAGLRKSYHLINMGNFRPELSIVVRPLQYEGSFHDLAFTVPTGASQSDILPTLVYHDDKNKLTDMFWWYTARLEAMNLPSSLVDIIHSGLSDPHQQRALNRFRDRHSVILLATEKIGAGIHLPHVKRVVQYLAHNNLSLPKLDQRRGRGARTKGTTAICYFLVEPRLMNNDLNEVQGTVDPGILALVRADGCYQDVLDKWLENPPRSPSSVSTNTRLCCSHCQPHLARIQEYQWIMVSDKQLADSTQSTLPQVDRDAVLKELRQLRLTAWREQWQVEWPSFGPRSLISDADLEAVAKVATSITSLDDLRPLTRIPYWNDFAPWLLSAVKASVAKLGLGEQNSAGKNGDGSANENRALEATAAARESAGGTGSDGVQPVVSASTTTSRNVRAGTKKANPHTGMHHAETILDFSV